MVFSEYMDPTSTAVCLGEYEVPESCITTEDLLCGLSLERDTRDDTITILRENGGNPQDPEAGSLDIMQFSYADAVRLAGAILRIAQDPIVGPQGDRQDWAVTIKARVTGHTEAASQGADEVACGVVEDVLEAVTGQGPVVALENGRSLGNAGPGNRFAGQIVAWTIEAIGELEAPTG